MAFDVDTFRENFAEFTSLTKYPDEMIEFWSGLGDKLLDQTKWDALGIRDQGLSLFTAHYITLAAMNVADVAVGADPGRSASLIGGEGVGGVNVSYDNAASLENGAGQWNSTSYGRQYFSLASLVGMGGAFI